MVSGGFKWFQAVQGWSRARFSCKGCEVVISGRFRLMVRCDRGWLDLATSSGVNGPLLEVMLGLMDVVWYDCRRVLRVTVLVTGRHRGFLLRLFFFPGSRLCLLWIEESDEGNGARMVGRYFSWLLCVKLQWCNGGEVFVEGLFLVSGFYRLVDLVVAW